MSDQLGTRSLLAASLYLVLSFIKMGVRLLQVIARMCETPAPHVHTWKLWNRGKNRVASPGPVSCSSGPGLGMTPKMVPGTISNATRMTTIKAVVSLGISVTVRSGPWGGAYLPKC